MELRGTYKGGGGPDKTILLSAVKHDKKRYYILVIYLREPKDNDFQIGAMVARLGVANYVEVLDRSKLDLKCLVELNRLLRSNNIQIIHVHDPKTILLGFLLKLLNPKIKIMYTAHGWMLNTDYDRLKQKLEFLMLRSYPMHIAVSEATKKLMIESGIKPDTIKVLYNSIDTDYWKNDGSLSTVREEFGLSNKSLIVGTVGRLSQEKGLPTFFKVVRNVINVYPNACFLIVGDGKGTIVDDLHQLVKEMGISGSVIFTGHRTDLRNIYLSFDLFLTTSLTEGLPNTVLEAMAIEVPVVATRVGGVPELVVDGQTGILCDTDDVDGITEVVLGLLSDFRQRQEFALNGRKRIVEKFSFDKRLESIETYYEYLANNL